MSTSQYDASSAQQQQQALPVYKESQPWTPPQPLQQQQQQQQQQQKQEQPAQPAAAEKAPQIPDAPPLISDKQAAEARTEFVTRLAQGQTPSKDDLLKGLDSAASKLQEAQQLAYQANKKEGEKTLRDARQLVETTKALAEDANRSGLIEKTQELAVESYKAAQAAAQEGKGQLESKGGKLESLKPSGEETQQIRSAAERLLSVLKMIVTSGEGRGIMMEFSELLKRVFHDFGDTLEEVTDTVTQAGVDAAREKHEETTDTAAKGEEKSGEVQERKMTAAEKKRAKKKRAKQRRQEKKAAAAKEQAAGGDHPTTAEGVKEKVKGQLEQKKCEMCDTKDQAEQTKQRVMDFMGKLADHPEVRQAVQDIVWIIRDYSSRINTEGKEVAESVTDAAKGAAEPHAKRAAELAEEVIRELAPGEILDHIQQLGKDIINTFYYNQKLQQFWANAYYWFNDILENPDQFKNNRDQIQDKFNELVQDGKETWHDVNSEVGPKMNELSDLFEELFDTLKNDTKLQELQGAVQRLQADLFTTDSAGKPQLKMEAISELKSIVAPMIANALRNIALPPIQYSDETYDFNASHVVLRADELLPDAIKFYAETMFNVEMKDLSSSHELGRFSIFIRGVQIEAKDFEFSINRKSFPSFKDEGHCDVVTSGKGVDIDISFREQTTHPFLSAPQARVRIDKLNITVHKDAYHRFLLNFITSVFRARIEKGIQDGVQKSLEENGLMLAEKINAQLYAWQMSMPSKFGSDKSSWSTFRKDKDSSSSSGSSFGSFETAKAGAPPIPNIPAPLKADAGEKRAEKPAPPTSS